MPRIANNIRNIKISETQFLSSADSEIDFTTLKPNISYQRAIANKKASKRKAATVLILITIVILLLVLLVGHYMFSARFATNKYTNSFFFTQGSISYYPVYLTAVEDLDTFNKHVKSNKSLDQFDGVTIRHYSKPALIKYTAVVEDSSVATVVAGKIYGLKANSKTSILFYSQDGTFLTRVTVEVLKSKL